MSWKIFGQPRRKKRSLFGLWRRRTKKERKKNLLEKKKVAEDESRVQNSIHREPFKYHVVDCFRQVGTPQPPFFIFVPKNLLNWGIPPPLQKKSAKEYYASPEFAKIYPNYLYAYDMNRMKDETGNIMMLNLENAENVCFGFTINPLPYMFRK